MEPKHEFPPANYTPEEMARLEMHRAKSDVVLGDSGAKYKFNEKGEKENLLVTEEHKRAPELSESLKNTEIVALPEFNGKRLSEVAEYIRNTYGLTHYIPGTEYLEYIIKSGSIPSEIEFDFKGERFYFFGDYYSGKWATFLARDYMGISLHKDSSSASSTWESGRRIVLIKK